MACDMCGSKEEKYVVIVENTEMNLCEDCKSYGRVIRRIISNNPKKIMGKKSFNRSGFINKNDEEDYVELLVKDFGAIIKNTRERLNKKQKELAKDLGIKEGLLHKIETGHFKPNIDLARKFEQMLNIRLLEKIKIQNKSFNNNIIGDSEKKVLTIGDLIKEKINKKK